MENIVAVKGNKLPIWKGKNYTGAVFSSWTVLGPIECVKGPTKYYTKWLCKCSCGQEKYVSKYSLLKGKSTCCFECSKDKRRGKKSSVWSGYEFITGSFFSTLKKNAEKRGLVFDLSIEYLNELWLSSKGTCAISGLSIHIGDTASLDRIDSNLGYTQGNVWWTHKLVNMIKNKYSLDVFTYICASVTKHQISLGADKFVEPDDLKLGNVELCTAKRKDKVIKRLTWEDVDKIRELSKTLGNLQIAEIFNTNQTHISRIVRGVRWVKQNESVKASEITF